MPAVFTFSNLLDKVEQTTSFQGREKGPFGMMFAKEQSDFDLWKKQIEEAEALANSVLPSIQKQIEQCDRRLEQCKEEQKRMLDQKSGMLNFTATSQSMHNRYVENLEALNQKYYEVQKQIQESVAALEAQRKEINNKREKAKKWIWVPFYNLQLTQDFKSEKEKYEHSLQVLGDLEKQAYEEQEKLKQELQKAEQGERSITRLILLMGYNIKKMAQRIDLLNRLTYQWNSFYEFFQYLKSDLSSKDDVADLVEEAKKEIEKAKEAEESIPFDLFYPTGSIETGWYRIMTQDEKIEMVSQGLNQHLSFQKTQESNLDHNLLILNLANGASMILDKDFYILSTRYNDYEMVMSYFADSENQYFEINGTDQDAVIFPKGKQDRCLGTPERQIREGLPVLLRSFHMVAPPTFQFKSAAPVK